jgi:hypothetical protein
VAVGVFVAASLIALAVAGGALLVTWRDERAARDTASAHEAVIAAEQEALPRRITALHEAEGALDAAEARLGNALDGLFDGIGERHITRTELAAVRAELDRVLAAATAAEADAWGAAAAVAALGSCLDQVSAILNQVAVGDTAGAARAIERLAPSCDLAGAVG